MIRHLVIILAALAAPVHATTVGLHWTTKHAHAGYCEYNPGLYVRTDDGFTAGTYRNSECRQSVYIGQTFTHGIYSVTVGGVTGYTRRTVTPMIVPSVALPLADGVSLRLALAARAVHVSVERKF